MVLGGAARGAAGRWRRRGVEASDGAGIRYLAALLVVVAVGLAAALEAPAGWVSAGPPPVTGGLALAIVAALLGCAVVGTPRVAVLVLELGSVPALSVFVYLAGTPHTVVALLYLWGLPFTVAVLGRRIGMLHAITIATCYGAVTLVMLAQHRPSDAELRKDASFWLVLTATAAATGLVTDLITTSARRATERFRSGFEGSVVGTAIVGRDGLLREANAAFCSLLRRSAKQVVGEPLARFAAADDVELVEGLIADYAPDRPRPRVEVQLQPAVGDTVLTEVEVSVITEGRSQFLYCQFRDVTEARRAHDLLAWQATTDSLTQLPNRAHLNDCIAGALKRRLRSGACVAVMLLDLDRFKLVNDSLGHTTGDELLVAVAARLRAVCRGDTTVARIGGDEFVVVSENLAGADEATVLAERLLDAARETTRLHGLDVNVTASVGIAMTAPRPPRVGYLSSVDPEDLIRHADIAMYAAKSAGGNAIVTFDDTLRHRASVRLRTEVALREALRTGQLEVQYQPIVDLANGRWTSLEALIRWHHPDRGLLSPGEFVAIAEETDLIAEIGCFVLRQACTDLAILRDAVPAAASLRVGVNVSARQLSRPGFADQLSGLLDEVALPKHSIGVEITESLLMRDRDVPGAGTVAAAELEKLRALGVTVLVDDFGTGFSSLSYLRQLPVDVVKIDRSFVSGSGENLEDPAIVKAILELARALHLDVVAEGVESERQRTALRELGCSRGQGYLFGRAMSISSVQQHLAVAAQRPAPARAGLRTRRAAPAA